MKILACADLMPWCRTLIEGKDVPEVLAKAEEHMKTDHGMLTVPAAIIAKAEAAIQDG